MIGYSYAWDRSSHVIYWGNDEHIHELWFTQSSPVWHDADLTAVTGAPVSLVPMSGFEQGGAQHVIALALGGSAIWKLSFTPSGGWQAQNLTKLTGAVPGSLFEAVGIGRGDDFGLLVPYQADDGFLHALQSPSGTGWTDLPISRLANAAAPSNGIDVFQSSGSFRLVVLYAVGYRLHELFWTEATGWSDVDVTASSGGPHFDNLYLGSGLFFEADASDRIFTHDQGGALWEYVRTRDDRWYVWKDLAYGAVATDGEVSAFAAPDDAAGNSYTEYVSYVAQDRHLHVMDFTAPWVA